MRFDNIATLNPTVSIKRGTIAPCLGMAALPIHGRDVVIDSKKPFTGSGARFENGDMNRPGFTGE